MPLRPSGVIPSAYQLGLSSIYDFPHSIVHSGTELLLLRLLLLGKTTHFCSCSEWTFPPHWMISKLLPEIFKDKPIVAYRTLPVQKPYDSLDAKSQPNEPRHTRNGTWNRNGMMVCARFRQVTRDQKVPLNIPLQRAPASAWLTVGGRARYAAELLSHGPINL